jgi:hypothetical protein
MLRIPLNALEEARKNPKAFRTLIENPDGKGRNPSYFSALRYSIMNFHKWQDPIRARGDLEGRLEKFKDQRKCIEIMDQYEWYVLEYRSRGWRTFSTLMNIEVSLPDWVSRQVKCTGQVSRIDLVPTGGFAAWLLRSKNPAGWENDIQMALIQESIANVMNAPMDEIRVGIYSFNERYIDSRIFSRTDIDRARIILNDTLLAMGFQNNN